MTEGASSQDCGMIMAEESGCSEKVTSATRRLHTSVPLRHTSDGWFLQSNSVAF